MRKIFLSLRSLVLFVAAPQIFCSIDDNAVRPSSSSSKGQYSLIGVGLPMRLDEGTAPIPSVPIADKVAHEIHRQMVERSLAMLVTAIGNRHVKRSRSKPDKAAFEQCSRKAGKLSLQAKCVSTLLGARKRAQLRASPASASRRGAKPSSTTRWVGAFRTAPKYARARLKREVTSRTSYTLLSRGEGLSPLGSVARMLTKFVVAKKGRTSILPWDHTVDKLRRLNREWDTVSGNDKDRLDAGEEHFKGMPKALGGAGGLARDELGARVQTKMARLLKDGLRIVEVAEARARNIPYDPAPNNRTTLNVLSPRFLSLQQADEPLQADRGRGRRERVDLLSPSLFSLHEPSRNASALERETSIPRLLNRVFTGGETGSRDQREWMNLIMEASNIEEHTKELERKIVSQRREFMGVSGVDASERLVAEARAATGPPRLDRISRRFGKDAARSVQTIQRLNDTLTTRQKRELADGGFSIMDKTQLRLIYGPSSPYNDSATLARLSRLSRREISARLEGEVHQMAEIDSFRVRQKAPIILKPFFFRYLTNVAILDPIILSPIVFTPVVLSYGINGPLILSPVFFSPVILGPRLTSPLILSPSLFSPLILAPLALRPIILSPSGFSPGIMTPLVLGPPILSPNFLSPFILSPVLLSPKIFSPTAGSPTILSPFVLSPVIYSPNSYGGIFLSPHALSPKIGSPTYKYTSFLSPGFLS